MSACATLPEEGSHKEVRVPAPASTLRLPKDRFDPVATTYGIASNRLTGETIETASYRADDAFLVVQLRRGAVGLELTRRPLEAMLQDWTHDAPLAIHAAEDRDEEGVDIALTAFRVDRWKAECVGFREAGAVFTAAPAGRRSGMVFGIFCSDGEEPLSLESAADLLHSVRLRDKAPPPPKPPVPMSVFPTELYACQACEPGA